MSYVTVEDFRAGLDVRRDPVSGTPGSLFELTNAHITRGGDIEARKSFVSTYALPVAQTFGLQAASSLLYVFGSAAAPGVPPGVTYQRLSHPDGLTMTKIIYTEVFNGKVYAIAQYSDSSIHHFYDGVLITDWMAGIVRTGMTNNVGIATHLVGLINAGTSGVTATNGAGTSSIITLTGSGNNAFTLTATAFNGGATNNQTAVVATSTPANPGTAEVLATARFTVTGGTASAGVNKITSITLNGVEVLGGSVDWITSNSQMATNLATQINSNVSSPDYSATSSVGTVTISALAGTGNGPNGFVLGVTVAGTVTVASLTNMAGGANPGSGQNQVSTVTIGGTFEANDQFTVKINTSEFGATGNPASDNVTTKGITALTYKNKVYSAATSLLNFCGVDSPTVWNRDQTANPGAGFINFANQSSGSETITAVGLYQGNLAVFTQNTISIEFVDVDPTLNRFLQPLYNTGTLSPRSVISYGNNDLFYLAASGIRSLRARDASNAAFISDVGTAIDQLVLDYTATLSAPDIANAYSILEPIDGRYWLAVGTNIYVFTYFPGSKISAWSLYQPGFQISHMTILGNRVYVRSGDTVYLYGGPANNSYPAANEAPITVRLPFLSVGKVASPKDLKAFDAALTGTWTVSVLLDPNDLTKKTADFKIYKYTYPNGKIPINGRTTHFAPKLTCSAGGHVTITNLCIHYESAEED